MEESHQRDVSKYPFRERRVTAVRLCVSHLRSIFVFLPEGELTSCTYHIGVRAKFTTVTVGSSAIIGINCVLRRQACQWSDDVHDSDFQRTTENDSLRGAAVAQYANALSTEVYIVPPARRMENLALERLDAL